jgi:hypothetical protein
MDSHDHACQHHSAASTGAQTCGGTGPCGGTADCATGSESCTSCTPLAMPTTDEQVSLPANDVATLLDLVEAFAGSSYDEDGAYSRANAALRMQAPNLVAAREQLLETFREMAGRAIQGPGQ